MANFDFDFSVKGFIPEIRQIGYTCWAAAAAMMHSWRKQQTFSTAKAIAVAGSPYIDYLKKGKALPHTDTRNFAFAMGMRSMVMRSMSDVQMLNLMQGRQTPLMVSVLSSGASMGHFYVIKGMKTEDGGSGLVNMTVNNSNADPVEETMYFEDLLENMERQATESADVEKQILHY